MRTSRALLITMCLVSGCGRGTDDAELVKLSVAFTLNLTMAPVFIAHAEGFFEEQGLDVELVGIESAATALPALLQGRLDVLPGPLSPSFFNAITRGGRLRLVGDKGSFSADDCFHQALVVSAKTIARGTPVVLRRVGTAKNPFFQFFVERALAQHGFNLDDIELVHVPQAAEYDAVMAGRLDAAMIGEPWLTRVLKGGGGVVWTQSNTLLDGFNYSTVLYGPRLLDQDPELGRRFAVGMLKGIRRYNEGKTERNLEILAGALGHDPGELRDVCWPAMREDGQVNTESILEFQRWGVARGDLDALVPAEQFWDSRFMEHAARVLNGGS